MLIHRKVLYTHKPKLLITQTPLPIYILLYIKVNNIACSQRPRQTYTNVTMQAQNAYCRVKTTEFRDTQTSPFNLFP